MYSVVLMAALTAGTNQPSWGFGCHGCHGFFGSLFSCHGCHGCFGCHGCYGGCYGGGCYGGCYGGGCYGGCYGTSCYGCYGGGCYGCYGGCRGTVGAPAAAPAMKPAEQVPAPKPKEENTTTSLDRARLIVELPADAKLYVDDQPMQTSSNRREFKTPVLEQGQTYYYILRAEAVRNGKTIAETKRVVVQGGDVVRAAFSQLGEVTVARAETILKP